MATVLINGALFAITALLAVVLCQLYQSILEDRKNEQLRQRRVQIQFRWDRRRRVRQLKREEEQRAHDLAQQEEQKAARKRAVFCELIANFPGGPRNIWGYSFNGWQDQLAELERCGLGLDGPSDDFNRLKKSVKESLAFNHACAAQSTNAGFDPNTRASFAISIPSCLRENETCMKHLEAMEATWAMVLATAPATGNSKLSRRL